MKRMIALALAMLMLLSAAAACAESMASTMELSKLSIASVDGGRTKSIRLKKGSLSINLQLTNLLNNTSIVTGGYEQSRSNYSVNSTSGEVGSTRVYKFDRNPKKYYVYGINGMLNIGYKF